MESTEGFSPEITFFLKKQRPKNGPLRIFQKSLDSMLRYRLYHTVEVGTWRDINDRLA